MLSLHHCVGKGKLDCFSSVFSVFQSLLTGTHCVELVAVMVHSRSVRFSKVLEVRQMSGNC